MAGNWKMNPTSLAEASELAALVASAARTTQQDKKGFDVQVAVIPPFPFLPHVASALYGTFVAVGCQDVHAKDKGAFTGARHTLDSRTTSRCLVLSNIPTVPAAHDLCFSPHG